MPCARLAISMLLLADLVTGQSQGSDGTFEAADASQLYQLLNNLTAHAIKLTGSVQLTPNDWPDPVFISGNVSISGEPSVLDLGELVNAIYIQTGGTLVLSNLVVQGGAPLQSADPDEVAWLPQTASSNVWPSIVTDVDSTLMWISTNQLFYAPIPGATCQQYQAQVTVSLKLQGIDYMASPNGLSITVMQTDWSQPVVDSTDQAFLGTASFKTFNATGTCVDIIPGPTQAPSPAQLDYSLATSNGKSGLSSGGIAGVVVGVVGAAVVVAVVTSLLGLFVLRRARSQKAGLLPQRSSCDMSMGQASSGRTAMPSPQSKPVQVACQGDSCNQSQEPAERFMSSMTSTSFSQSMSSGESAATSLGFLKQFEWRICPNRISICQLPDGRPFKLGSGGHGIVYKAVLDNTSEVAIKFLKTEGPEVTPHSMRQFAMEVDIMRACRDPHIVNFLGAWLEPSQGVSYLVQEYLEEGDLASALASDQRASEFLWYNRGRSIALSIAQALHYLHSNAIIHFDVKSGNCLLTRAKTAKLADVGLSHALASQSHLSGDAMRGTWAYASPEACAGTACTFKSDIWSFGVLLWEIITGERPQRGRYRLFRVPEECPQQIADLVDACMSSNPEERPTAKAVIRAILADKLPR